MINSKFTFFILLGTILIITSLSGCGSDGNNNVTMISMVKEDAKIILEGIENSTYESTAELFSSYVRENYPTLSQDIAELMEYIDGEIVSYERVLSDTTGGHSTGEGWVEKRFEGRIYKVKTNTNKTFNIKFGGYYINKEKPETVGVQYIIIESFDDLDENGYHVEKSIYYE